MTIKSIFIMTLLLLKSVFLFSQSGTDKKEIYNAVLKSYLDDERKSKKEIRKEYKVRYKTKLFIMDSTVKAPYPGKAPDSIYVKYFHFDKPDRIKLYENIYIPYLDSTMKLEKVPCDIFQNKKLRLFPTDSITNIFCLCEKEPYIDTDSCWSKFHKVFNFDGFCGFSKPFFINKDTSMLYFFEITGSLAGSGFTYVLHKENNRWIVVCKIFQWVS